MRKNGKWMFVVGLLVGLSAHGAGELDSQSTQTNQLAAADIWAGMLEQGMIDDEQYEHVLQTGHLPGGSVLTNSPVPVAEQAGWNRLAEHEVITPEELAQLLFGGTILGMDEEEQKALAELAPVYQPNRAKRLAYEVRRKHARVELLRMARQFRAEHEARTVNLEERAAALGLPMERGEAVLVGIDESDEPIYIQSNGISACDTISADEVWTTNAVGNINTNFNLTGAGVTLAMWEKGGAKINHQEFSGRITSMTSQDLDIHANAVAAVMMGVGIETNAMGMAPAASLHAFSWRDFPHDELADVAYDGLIYFSNHSYNFSDQYGGRYAYPSLKRDEIVYTAEYHLPVISAGNDREGNPNGYNTLAGGVAKNVLSVGAVAEIPGGYAGINSAVIYTNSGWGPTDDDRIKPDLVAGEWSGWAPYVTTNYDYNEEGAYGTSFAAPAVAGSFALLQELHEKLNGTNAVPLLASTWKALLIHTADEAGDHPGPDYRFGWGLANVWKAAELMATDAQWGGNHLIKEFMLADGDRSFFNIELDGGEPLIITIAWTDPSGPWLVNDVDLRVVGPDDTVHQPFVLDPDAPTAPATTGDNALDNVEQVVLTNTVAGFYTVVVDHKGTLIDEDQDVSGQAVSMVLNAGIIPFATPDPMLTLSKSTNGLPRLEWEAVPGALQAVVSSDNLVIPSQWAARPDSTQSILRVVNEWIDPAGFSDEARFYKIQDIE